MVQTLFIVVFILLFSFKTYIFSIEHFIVIYIFLSLRPIVIIEIFKMLKYERNNLLLE